MVPASTSALESPSGGRGHGGEGEEVLKEVVLGVPGRRRLPRHGRRRGGGDRAHASGPEASSGSRQATAAAVRHRDLRGDWIRVGIKMSGNGGVGPRDLSLLSLLAPAV